MIDLKTLRLITKNGSKSFGLGHILDGIDALRTLLPYCATETVIYAEAEGLEKNYHYMLSFLRQGGDDEKRSEVQAKIQRQGIILLEQASRAIRLSLNTDLYCKTLARLKDIYEGSEGFQERILEAYKSSPLSGELEGVHQDDLFDLLWTSPLWTAQDTARWYDFFLGQRDMVQQHFMGGVFLSAWEHYDSEKIQLLNLLADSECHRTHITAVTYLLLLRLRHKELTALMPPLPDSLLSRKGRQLISQVQYEMLLMLISEKDMEKELKESETLSQELFAKIKSLNINDIKNIIEMKGRYLKNRLQRGLDPNLTKTPLLHSCEYMHRISHWFQPFDKKHPLFQSVMIDDKGNEKQKLSTMVDLILDCDVDKMATLYLVSNDKDFSKAVQAVEEQELPDLENAVIPEYTFRLLIQDLYRFFGHSPLSSQLVNPFRQELTLLDFPDLAILFSTDNCLSNCNLILELASYAPEQNKGRLNLALTVLDNLIEREGASVPALLLKGMTLRQLKQYTEAISCVRSAEILQPDNTDILRFLIECYAIQHRFEEELEYLLRLSELLPENMKIRRLIPVTMNKIGRKEEALQLFFKLDYESTEDDEDYATIISNIADTALALDKLDIAERYTEKELELSDGKNWVAQLRMGHVRLLQGDWKRSLDCYEQFVNIFCELNKAEAKTAISEFNKSQEMLVSKGIKKEDLLLIHDILQAAVLK